MKETLKIYLDTNIISNLKNGDRLSGDTKLIFNKLLNLLSEKKDNCIIPYSTAHILDLKTSYYKGDLQQTNDSLEFISSITKDLCISQYLGDDHPILHERNPRDFFDSVINEEEDDFYSIENLERIMIFDAYKNIPHNMIFEDGSLFSSLFPLAKEENSLYALIKDIYFLFKKNRTDPNLYKALSSLFKEGIKINADFNNYGENVISKLDALFPKTVLNKTFTELHSKEVKLNSNNSYQKITSIYMTLDFVGFNPDKIDHKNKYDNIFNDSLHCFYAAHCDFYLTADKKSYKKAKAVYESINCGTVVLKPEEFFKV